jgi:transposase-like protein
MKPTLHFFCEKCEQAVSLRVGADSTPRCPHCQRESLVLVNTPAGTPVTPEVARAAFATMHQVVSGTIQATP